MDRSTKESPQKLSQESERIPKFLKILYQILENKNYKEYISWSEDGRVLIINKPEEFADDLLPLYFKHNNYASFVRQVILVTHSDANLQPTVESL